jgi:G3E family GTPase
MTEHLPGPPALPVIVIGGYLGAGKTTLLNHLLRHAQGRRLAVLVNDFGELSIDADLIVGQDGDVLRLAGGCVCCAIGSDLIESLVQLGESPRPPDLVLIETSGVALPGAVGRGAKLAPGVRLEGVVVMVDASCVQTLAGDRHVGDTVLQQLHDADLLVMNKIDLLEPVCLPGLRQWLQEQAPGAVMIEAIDGQVPAHAVLGLRLHDDATDDVIALGSRRDRIGPRAASVPAASRFSTFTAQLPQSIDVPALIQALSDPRLGIVRAKGIVTDLVRGPLVLQGVGARWRADAASPEQAASASAGKLVVIGLADAFDPDTLAALIDAHTARAARPMPAS